MSALVDAIGASDAVSAIWASGACWVSVCRVGAGATERLAEEAGCSCELAATMVERLGSWLESASCAEQCVQMA